MSSGGVSQRHRSESGISSSTPAGGPSGDQACSTSKPRRPESRLARPVECGPSLGYGFPSPSREFLIGPGPGESAASRQLVIGSVQRRPPVESDSKCRFTRFRTCSSVGWRFVGSCRGRTVRLDEIGCVFNKTRWYRKQSIGLWRWVRYLALLVRNHLTGRRRQHGIELLPRRLSHAFGKRVQPSAGMFVEERF